MLRGGNFYPLADDTMFQIRALAQCPRPSCVVSVTQLRSAEKVILCSGQIIIPRCSRFVCSTSTNSGLTRKVFIKSWNEPFIPVFELKYEPIFLFFNSTEITQGHLGEINFLRVIPVEDPQNLKEEVQENEILLLFSVAFFSWPIWSGVWLDLTPLPCPGSITLKEIRFEKKKVLAKSSKK